MVKIKSFVILLSFLVFAGLLVGYLADKRQENCLYLKNGQGNFHIVEIILKDKAKVEHKFCILENGKNTLSQVLTFIKIPNGLCSEPEKITLQSGSAVIVLRKRNKVEIYTGRMTPRFRLILGLSLDINSAPPEILKEIPYLNSRVVDSLVSRREKKPFSTLSEILEIRGMGIRTFNKVSKKLECLPSPPKPHLVCSIPYQS